MPWKGRMRNRSRSEWWDRTKGVGWWHRWRAASRGKGWFTGGFRNELWHWWGRFSQNIISFLTNTMAPCGFHHFFSLEKLWTAAYHSGVLTTPKIPQPTHKWAYASSTIPHVSGKAYGGQWDPCCHRLLRHIGQFVGFQVEDLKVGQAVKHSWVQGLDFISRQIKFLQCIPSPRKALVDHPNAVPLQIEWSQVS